LLFLFETRAMNCRNHIFHVKPCLYCEGEGWVCENHPDQPFAGPHACRCGGAGMPCPKCNPSSQDEPPRLPKGFEPDD
jgi:hypothetical protein